MARVFQYGSNCDTQRLNSPKRLGDVARSLGKARTEGNFELAFDVWSTGNNCAASDLIQRGNTVAWGVLYEIPEAFIYGPRRADGRKTLAQIEGRRYERRCIRVIAKGQTYSAITFLVRESDRVSGKPTSSAYVWHIVKGLRDHDVPEDYVDRVIATALESLMPLGQAGAAERTRIEGLRRQRVASQGAPPAPMKWTRSRS